MYIFTILCIFDKRCNSLTTTWKSCDVINLQAIHQVIDEKLLKTFYEFCQGESASFYP